jgi:putative transposase
VETILGLRLDIAEKPEGKGFHVVSKRWVVERTFAWLGNFRRVSKDDEILTSSAENMVRIAMLKMTLAKCL